MEKLFPASGLTLCIDFNSLTTYLALGDTRKLVDDMQVEVHFLPLVRTPGSFSIPINNDDPLAEYKARRARARKTFADGELQRNCERLGISVDQGGIAFDPTHAAVGLLWLKQIQANAENYWRYIEAVFSDAFRGQKPMEDVSLIRDLLTQSHLSTTGFNDFVASNNLRRIQEVLLESGIFDSPAYVYAGERFQGRQHLPLLRWLMGGRQGAPPV